MNSRANVREFSRLCIDDHVCFSTCMQAEQQAAFGKVDGLHAHIASLQQDIQALKVTELHSAMTCKARRNLLVLSQAYSQVCSAEATPDTHCRQVFCIKG